MHGSLIKNKHHVSRERYFTAKEALSMHMLIYIRLKQPQNADLGESVLTVPPI